MTHEAANKTLVRNFLEDVFNRADMAASEAYIPESGMLFNGIRVKHTQLVGWTLNMRKSFPDFRLVIEDQIAEGDKIVTRVTFHVTHDGDFQGIAPTGKQVAYSGIGIDRVSDGKVMESWHVADIAGLLRQLSKE